jgi:hypothetical protein
MDSQVGLRRLRSFLAPRLTEQDVGLLIAQRAALLGEPKARAAAAARAGRPAVDHYGMGLFGGPHTWAWDRLIATHAALRPLVPIVKAVFALLPMGRTAGALSWACAE